MVWEIGFGLIFSREMFFLISQYPPDVRDRFIKRRFQILFMQSNLNLNLAPDDLIAI